MVRKPQLPPSSRQIQKTEVRGDPLTFSFKHFANDTELCPSAHPDGYTQKLLERLKDLSGWTLGDFIEKRSKTVRNHRIAWPETSRPEGFMHLPLQVREGEAWQFSITANEYGRVHGLLIGSVFHVIWLDYNHRLYPNG